MSLPFIVYALIKNFFFSSNFYKLQIGYLYLVAVILIKETSA